MARPGTKRHLLVENAACLDLTALLRANLVRTLAWTGSTVLAAVLLA